MNQPFFSIIVVAYNAENTVRATLDSILSQTFTDYEIVFKDAVSSDKTLSMIPRDDRIRVYSTKDKGIYDGMNEAISYAQGRFIHFLNCGDTFYNETVLARTFELAKELDGEGTVLYGNYCKGDIFCKQPSKLTDFYLFRTALNHQSMFFERVLFEKFGCFRTDYTICADYDLTLRTFRANVRYLYCPYTICTYLGGGVSEIEDQKRREQNSAILSKHFSAREIRRFKIKHFLTFRKLRQFLYSNKSPKFIRKLYRKLINRVNS